MRVKNGYPIAILHVLDYQVQNKGSFSGSGSPYDVSVPEPLLRAKRNFGPLSLVDVVADDKLVSACYFRCCLGPPELPKELTGPDRCRREVDQRGEFQAVEDHPVAPRLPEVHVPGVQLVVVPGVVERQERVAAGPCERDQASGKRPGYPDAVEFRLPPPRHAQRDGV